MACLLTSAAFAQSSQKDPGCVLTGAFQDYEIAFEATGGLSWDITLTNLLTGAEVARQGVNAQTDVVRGCDWIVHFDGENAGHPWPRVDANPNTPYEIRFAAWGTSKEPVHEYVFTYYHCSDSSSLPPEAPPYKEGFYCPYGPDYYTPDTGFLYEDGEGMRVIPLRLRSGMNEGGVQRDVGHYFADSLWVLPYNAPDVCDQAGCTLSTSDLRDIPFLTPQLGLEAGSSFAAYTLTAGLDFDVPTGWSWTWDELDELRFQANTGLVVEGALSVSGMTFTKAGSLKWGGVEVSGVLAADDVIIASADVGVAVAAAGAATVTASSLLYNGTGLAVSGALTADDLSVKFADTGARVYPSGTADITGSTLQYNDTGLVVEGDLALSTTTVEGGAVGVMVYEPGTADLTGVTLRGNSTVGLDVLSAAGTTVAGGKIEGNGRGVRTGIPQEGPGGPVYCFGPCRSSVELVSTFVQNNVHAGVEAVDADVEIQNAFIWHNGDTGLRVSNATVLPFVENCVQNNGITHDSPGTSALPGAEFYVSPTSEPGTNRLADNQMAELVVSNGGYAFIGDATGFTGNNAVFDVGSVEPLISNGNKVNVDAFYTYWGTGTWPPTNAFNPVGSVDFYPYVLASDPTLNWCNSLRPEGPGLHTASAQADEAGGATARAGREELREAIRAARGALAAGPGADSAAVLVERLHNLHRLDREDGLGEWAATFGLLRSLRARLDGPSLSEGLRATAEAALEAEAVHLLTRGHHEEAEGLLAAWGEQVESPEVSGVLRMVEAHLTAANGEYGAASSLVASVAEAEPDEVMRRELMAVAALYAERAGVSGEGRGTPEAGVTEAAAERSLDAAEGPSLSVYPNPSQGQAVVALVLAEASEVRVAVYDVLGRRVAMLSEGLLGAGAHPFALDGSGLPAGVYLVRAEMTDRVVTRPITLLR